MPTRTSSFTSLVCVALNNPVRRCFGSLCSTASSCTANPPDSSRSASSSTSTSTVLHAMFTPSSPSTISSYSLPGVPMHTLAPFFSYDAASRAPSRPPMNEFTAMSSPVDALMLAEYAAASRSTWMASSRVGRMITPTTFCFDSWITSATLGAMHVSNMGTRYASVFPLPVIASTTTSLPFSICGIAAACTGAIVSKPFSSTRYVIVGRPITAPSFSQEPAVAPPAVPVFFFFAAAAAAAAAAPSSLARFAAGAAEAVAADVGGASGVALRLASGFFMSEPRHHQEVACVRGCVCCFLCPPPLSMKYRYCSFY
eukprot:Rhum_TRINITY_DN9807_c1_g1::Rhum_TRINITY_DN9807_c1_g1_i1::g.35476::m.35476